MKRNGFVEIFVLVLVLIAAGTVVISRQSWLKDALKSTSSPRTASERSFDLTPIINTQSPTPTSASLPLPSVSPSSTPRSVSKTTPTPSPFPKPSSTPVVAKKISTCSVNALTNSNNPLAIDFYSGVSTFDNKYIISSQWDFNGDGTWDTDMSSSNSTTYTYSGNGTYTAKLRVKLSDGEITDTCTKSVTVPQGVKVSFTGQIYRDVNCNGTHEPNEGGISNVEVNFFTPEYNLYKTITTDANGYYDLSMYISQSDSITLKSSSVAAPGYKIHQSNYPHTTINAAFPTINKDLPQVPNENIGSCGG